MRLLLDENLSPRLSEALSASGHDAVSARGAHLSGAHDYDIRAFCIRENRVLVTLDADFGNILRFPPGGTPGVLWLKPPSFSNPAIAFLLISALAQLADRDMTDLLAVVDEKTIRIRPGILSS